MENPSSYSAIPRLQIRSAILQSKVRILHGIACSLQSLAFSSPLWTSLSRQKYPGMSKDEIFESVERFYHRYCLRPKPIQRIMKTMLEDKDVRVRRLREGYEFFKSMAQRRSDLEAAKGATA